MEEKKEPDLEELFGEIEEILEKMEERDISLEHSFLLYEEGKNTMTSKPRAMDVKGKGHYRAERLPLLSPTGSILGEETLWS